MPLEQFRMRWNHLQVVRGPSLIGGKLLYPIGAEQIHPVRSGFSCGSGKPGSALDLDRPDVRTFDPEPAAAVCEERWPPAMTITFVAASSTTLWALIISVGRWALS